MSNKIKKITQRGDTIIEVLLAMTVIGLTLGISYGIANRAVLTGQLAQERTEALKLAESQIEIMKANISSGAISQSDYEDVTRPYCVSVVTPKQPTIDGVGDPIPGVCESSFYNYYILYSNTGATSYRVTVEWDTPSSVEKSKVEVVYRP